MTWPTEILLKIVREHFYEATMEDRNAIEKFSTQSEFFFELLLGRALPLIVKSKEKERFPLDFIFYLIDSFKKRIDKQPKFDASNIEELRNKLPEILLASILAASQMQQDLHKEQFIERFASVMVDADSNQLAIFKKNYNSYLIKHLVEIDYNLEIHTDTVKEYLIRYGNSDITEKIISELTNHTYHDKELLIEKLKAMHHIFLIEMILANSDSLTADARKEVAIRNFSNLIKENSNIIRLKTLIDILSNDVFLKLFNTDETISIQSKLIKQIQITALNCFRAEPLLNTFVNKHQTLAKYFEIFYLEATNNKNNFNDERKSFDEELKNRNKNYAKKKFDQLIMKIKKTKSILFLSNILDALKNQYNFLKCYAYDHRLSCLDMILDVLQNRAFEILSISLVVKYEPVTLKTIIAYQKIWSASELQSEKMKNLFNNKRIEIAKAGLDSTMLDIAEAKNMDQLQEIRKNLDKPECKFLQDINIPGSNHSFKDEIIELLHQRMEPNQASKGDQKIPEKQRQQKPEEHMKERNAPHSSLNLFTTHKRKEHPKNKDPKLDSKKPKYSTPPLKG